MDPIIQDALRLALQRRRYDFGGQVEWSAPKEPEPVKQPDEEEQEKFLKEQLEGSAPQYEPEAGLKTAAVDVFPTDESDVMYKRNTYKRLTHPDGFYSRAHEVAMNDLPEGKHKWSKLREMLAEAPGLQTNELEASGLHDDVHDEDHELTREELADIIERHFPKVEIDF